MISVIRLTEIVLSVAGAEVADCSNRELFI